MKKFIKILICLCIILAAACCVKDIYYKKIYEKNCITAEINNNVQPWNLILVNKNNKITKNMIPELITTENGEQIAKEVYPFLKELFEAAKSEGFSPELTSGYRSEDEQRELFNSRIDEYRDMGYSKIEAASLANKYAAKPNYSEHETGLAADINSLSDDKWKFYYWLQENSYKYGFILRYPSGKEDVTGIEYEPWHFRYVGIEAAEYIYNNSLTLEEYLLK